MIITFNKTGIEGSFNVIKAIFKNQQLVPGSVPHICNPSYSGGRDQKD
jgi:hypothetical protein